MTKNNQNCQKIELYGNLATKELKKKYSSRLLGGMKGSWGREGLQAGGSWRTVAGKAAAHRPGEVAPGGWSGSTFACG